MTSCVNAELLCPQLVYLQSHSHEPLMSADQINEHFLVEGKIPESPCTHDASVIRTSVIDLHLCVG